MKPNMLASRVIVWVVAAVLAGLLPTTAHGQEAKGKASLVAYVRGRNDLTRTERKRWLREVRKRFGGSALKSGGDARPEIAVAKTVLSTAIFMRKPPKEAVAAAWEAWRGALGYVPPPIAVHYQILTLQGRPPRGRPIDLAFNFPDYYNEEIAPELVAYWEQALAAGKIPDAALRETLEALDATRIKMRPLLLDKLRLLARLARERSAASGADRIQIDADIQGMEAELQRSFSKVARRPEVLDARKAPYDRLRIQIEDSGLSLTPADRALDPRAPPALPRPVPKVPSPPPDEQPTDGPPIYEPDSAPIAPLPPQAQPGDRKAPRDPLAGRSLADLALAYAQRLGLLIEPWLGTPYRWGNDRPKVGTDCSGFIRRLFSEGFGVVMPRVSRDQFRVGRSVRYDNLRPGDLVFFDTLDLGRISHVGVYVGKGRFAHASSSKGVIYARLGARYYRRAYRGARRILAYPR